MTANCNPGAGRLPGSEQRAPRRCGAGTPIFGLFASGLTHPSKEQKRKSNEVTGLESNEVTGLGVHIYEAH